MSVELNGQKLDVVDEFDRVVVNGQDVECEIGDDTIRLPRGLRPARAFEIGANLAARNVRRLPLVVVNAGETP